MVMVGVLIFVLIVIVAFLAASHFYRKLQASAQSRRTAWTNAALRANTPLEDANASVSGFDAARSRTRPLTWLGPKSELRFQGFTIRSPLTYASKGSSAEPRTAEDPSEIDTSLPVRFDNPSPGLQYWPWYARMDAAQRGYYIQWLATAKAAWPCNDGFAFVYYYGLERRVLVDRADWRIIAEEVHRLRRLERARVAQGAEGRSFRRYSNGLLWHIAALHLDQLDEKVLRAIADATECADDESLATLGAWFVSKRQPLPAWAAYKVASQLPGSQRSVVAARVPEQFVSLFEKRYKARYPTGLDLRASASPRRVEYRPASAALGPTSAEIPDVWSDTRQFRGLSEIWNGCIEDLRELSRADQATGAEKLTVAAWEALPPELRAGVEHPCTKSLCALVAARATDAGCVLALGELAAIGGKPQRAKLAIGESRALAEMVEQVGYCMEPDARLTGRAYAWDDPVSLFARWDDSSVDVGRYKAAALMLTMGTAIAEADGKAEGRELDGVTRHIENAFNLTGHERRRLDALRALLAGHGADAVMVGKKTIAALEPVVRGAVGRLLVAVAAADGVITPDETKALKRGFRMLDLAPEVLDRTIAELLPGAKDDMVTVRPGATPPAGEKLPPQDAAAAESGLRLNRDVIQRIMEETREVSALLADAMGNTVDSDGEASAITAPPAVGGAGSSPAEAASMSMSTAVEPDAAPLKALPGRYHGFLVELAVKDRWSRTDLAAMAARRGVMVDGAIEAINEWSLDSVGHVILEEDGPDVIVDCAAARPLLGTPDATSPDT